MKGYCYALSIAFMASGLGEFIRISKDNETVAYIVFAVGVLISAILMLLEEK